MRFHFVLVFAVFGLAFLTFSLKAQGQRYPFVQIPNAPTTCLFPFQDHRGALWLAGCETGDEGLYYFDGSRFLSPVTNAVPKGVVRGIEEDSEDGIWLASSTGIYRIHNGLIEKIFEGVASMGITKVAENVFLLSVGVSFNDSLFDDLGRGDLVRISKAGEHWNKEILKTNFPQTGLRVDRSGSVLYGCDGGYCEMRAEDVVGWRPGSNLAITRHFLNTGDRYSGGSVVLRDRFGCVWLRRSDASYQCPGETYATQLSSDTASIGFPAIFELEDGKIAIPSYSKLAIGRPGNFQIITEENGYPGSAALTVARDGSIWHGASFFYPYDIRMEFWSAEQGLGLNTWSVLRIGSQVFAIAGDSIRLLENDRTRWRLFAKLPQAVYLIAGPNNSLMAASLTKGVTQYDMAGRILRRSAPAHVKVLARTSDGQYWAQENGPVKVNFRGRQIIFETTGMQRGADMKVDREDILWACAGNRIYHRDPTGWQSISANVADAENGCSSFAIDQSNNVWYSSSRNLTFIRNPGEASESSQILRGAGEANDHFLNVDRRGWLWRGNTNGIFVATPQQALQGTWLKLDRSDGLPSTDTNQNSFFEDSDGSIWFGPDASIIHLFPPADLVNPSFAPVAFISSFSWGNSSPQMANLVNEFTSGVNVTAHIGSLQFDRRNAMHLRYRVLPSQTSWQSAAGFDIPLSKLSWGSHTLEVQAQLMTGPWSSTSAKTFTVLRPVWFSWPALLGFSVCGAVGAAVAHRWKKKRTKRASRLLPELAEWRLTALFPEIAQLDGSILDSRFEVGRILARGGFATVAEGRDLQNHGLPCAVKIFRRELMDKDWMNRRFRQEVLALEKVHHPNVVQIYGHGTTPKGSGYLVMEFIDGCTLRELLERGHLAPQTTADYLRQAGSALSEIHAHGICHRDLKPDNLMIRNTPKPGHELVLIDFSIAIVQDPDETMHGLSRAAGTLCYMAPEQSIGYADSSTDIYSLAKIVIEMLTGQRLASLLPDASMDLPDRVRELLAKLDLDLGSHSIDVISSALEFDPTRRPSNADQFANQIAADLGSVRPRSN